MTRYTIVAVCTLIVLAGAMGCKKDNAATHDPGAPMTVDSFAANTGGGGTELLISGNNFSADTSSLRVYINGNRLAIVNATYHQIMAVVPKKCGSGHVIVKAGSDSAVSNGTFVYTFTRTVSTWAGSGAAGFANGKGTDASFNFSGQNWYRSSGLAVDDNLNLYVADPGNFCIRKIDTAGNVTTFAGNPSKQGGNDDGTGTAATFSLPYGLAIDAAGNLYVADPGNGTVRKVTPDGTVTTWATNTNPWGIAVDPTTGAVYFTDTNSPGNIYAVTSAGVGSAIATGLGYPMGIGFDKGGNMYVTLNGEQVIRKFTAGAWVSSVFAGQSNSAGYVNGPAAEAKFAYPWGLSVDNNGNLYVAGNGTWDGGTYNPDQSVRYVEASTMQVSTFAGNGTAGFVNAIGAAAAFSAPTGVTVDKYGTVYVLDKNNNVIRKIVSE